MEKEITLVSRSEEETERIAHDFADTILEDFPSEKKALVIAFSGELGAGKTQFIKSLAEALGITERVASPSFVLLKRYKIKESPVESLIHIDAYRIEKPQETVSLGIEGFLENPRNIVCVEWPEKVSFFCPQIKVRMEHGSKENERIITIAS